MRPDQHVVEVMLWLRDPKHRPLPSAEALAHYLSARAGSPIADIARQMIDTDDLDLALAVARQGIDLAEAHRAPPEQIAVMRNILLHIASNRL